MREVCPLLRRPAPGARLLMMAFTKATPPVPAGVSESELATRFGDAWSQVRSHPARSDGNSAMKRAAAAWFCLSRR